ncbi:MAG: peptidoglycan-associated lipoprotein Pal [Acidobacteriaceae bacterium]
MDHSRLKKYPVALCLAAIMVLTGCHKKAAAPPPPPPPAPAPAPAPAPTASITVNPSVIDQGQSATVAWKTANATDVSIEDIGSVALNSSQSVSPTRSTTYTLTAKGPGGTVEANARLTVNPPQPKPVPPPPPITEEQLFEQHVHDIFFDYDKADIRTQDAPVVEQDSVFLKTYPDIKLLIEGHCDERGSEEYNIALGQKRAESLQKALVSDGIPASRIRVISYGKEKPFCTESNEQCWQQNRRDHLKIDR